MNETVLIVTALIDLGIVLAAYMLGREWLYVTIVINLLLITLFGAKLVSIFGSATNAGNVMYACVFFATYLLMEHGTARDGRRAIWIGASAIVMFLALSKLVLMMESVSATQAVSEAMEQILTIAPRIALASLVAYITAQYMNVWLYTFGRESASSVHWWVRVICVMMAAQLVDSVIFFSIGFFGTVEVRLVFESMWVGYMIKVLVGLAAVPLLYASHFMVRERVVG